MWHQIEGKEQWSDGEHVSVLFIQNNRGDTDQIQTKQAAALFEPAVVGIDRKTKKQSWWLAHEKSGGEGK